MKSSAKDRSKTPIVEISIGEKTSNFGSPFDLAIDIFHHIGSAKLLADGLWKVLKGNPFGVISQHPETESRSGFFHTEQQALREEFGRHVYREH